MASGMNDRSPPGGLAGAIFDKDGEMAGDWIPMRVTLRDDPDVIAMAMILDTDRDTVVGKLHRVWSWFNMHTENGEVSVAPRARQERDASATRKWIDQLFECDGLADALIDVGWIAVDKHSVKLHDFDRYNSNGAKRRLNNTKRQKTKRANDKKAVAPSSSKRRAESATEARPENRRKENIDPPLPPKGGQPRDPLTEAVEETFYPDGPPPSQRSRIDLMIGELRHMNATPSELRRRVERYRKGWPDKSCTLKAMVKHWNTFSEDPEILEDGTTFLNGPTTGEQATRRVEYMREYYAEQCKGMTDAQVLTAYHRMTGEPIANGAAHD